MNHIRAYEESYKDKRRIKDEEMWQMGMYVYNATLSAVEHNLAGKNAKSTYLKEPLTMTKAKETGEGLTKKERKKQVEAFFMALEVKKQNFEMNKRARDD